MEIYVSRYMNNSEYEIKVKKIFINVNYIIKILLRIFIIYKKICKIFQCSSAKSHDVLLKFKYMRRFETSGNNSQENMERSIHR